MKRIDSLRERRGSALIITLLVIATLTGLTVGFSEESGVELSLAGFSRDGYRAYEMARSAAHLGLSILGNEKDEDMEELRKEWRRFGAHPFPDQLPEEISFLGGISDENGKINVNALLNDKGEIDEERRQQLIWLFQALGIDQGRAAPLLDWLDSDDIERLDGAESHYYRGLPRPYDCGNGPFLSAGQIFLVKGFKDMDRLGEGGKKSLLDYLTIYSDGKININAASREVLESLSENLDAAVADTIIEYRDKNPFLSVEDLKNVVGIDETLFNEIKGWVSVESSAFSIETEGRCQEAVARIKAVAVKEEGRLKLIYWQVM